MSNLKVVGISGSGREGSVNSKLLDLAGRLLSERGVEFEAFDVWNDRIPMYELETELAHGFPASVKRLREKIGTADAILLASPEFNAGYTPLLKSIIDWGSRKDPETEVDNVWEGKVTAMMSASPGGLGGIRGQMALRQTLAHVRALLIPEFTIVPSAFDAFDENGSLKNERSLGELVHVLDRLTAVASKLKS